MFPFADARRSVTSSTLRVSVSFANYRQKSKALPKCSLTGVVLSAGRTMETIQFYVFEDRADQVGSRLFSVSGSGSQIRIRCQCRISLWLCQFWRRSISDIKLLSTSSLTHLSKSSFPFHLINMFFILILRGGYSGLYYYGNKLLFLKWTRWTSSCIFLLTKPSPDLTGRAGDRCTDPSSGSPDSSCACRPQSRRSHALQGGHQAPRDHTPATGYCWGRHHTRCQRARGDPCTSEASRSKYEWRGCDRAHRSKSCSNEQWSPVLPRS